MIKVPIFQCRFCQKDCRSIYHDLNEFNYGNCYCDQCHVEFGYHKGEVHWYRMERSFRKKWYRIFVRHKEPEYCHLTDTTNQDSEVISFQFAPNITPKNYKRKLATLLTFS